jgi:hypothetical protein
MLRNSLQSLGPGLILWYDPSKDLKKLSELEVRQQHQLKVSNRFAALENLNVSEDINRAWENVKENIKISAKESLCLHERKQHKPWFDEERAEFLDKRKAG